MNENESIVVEGADHEIIITRLLDAPRELVWKVWTTPEHVAQWWGPNGFTTTTEVMEVRPGGVWKHIMHGPDGTDYPNKSVFLEVIEPERIVYSHGDGEREWFKATVLFTVEGNCTRVTLQQEYPSAEARNEVALKYGAIEGGQQHLARLAGFLREMAG